MIFTKTISAELSQKLESSTFTKTFVLVDENTRELCLPIIQEVLPTDYQLILMRSGEIHKTLETCTAIWQALTDANADRKALIINLGGGVICDMGGFCARTYKRGISFWNMPTTLLSQVDASIGGKLGIDFGLYKNHIGLFSKPDEVLIDGIFLQSLPERELVSGYAEIVKHSLIADELLFKELLQGDFNDINWSSLVLRAVAIKQAIVDQDPKEKGIRKILNFGHSVGHALESYYLPTKAIFKHGEAIAMGMVIEIYISMEQGFLLESDGNKIIKFLNDNFPMKSIEDDAVNSMIHLMHQDKKNTKGAIKLVLLKGVGKAVFDIETSEDEIKRSLSRYNELVGSGIK